MLRRDMIGGKVFGILVGYKGDGVGEMGDLEVVE